MFLVNVSPMLSEEKCDGNSLSWSLVAHSRVADTRTSHMVYLTSLEALKNSGLLRPENCTLRIVQQFLQFLEKWDVLPSMVMASLRCFVPVRVREMR